MNLTPVLAGVRTRGAFTRIFRTEPIFNAGALVVDGMRIGKNRHMAVFFVCKSGETIKTLVLDGQGWKERFGCKCMVWYVTLVTLNAMFCAIFLQNILLIFCMLFLSRNKKRKFDANFACPKFLLRLKFEIKTLITRNMVTFLSA